MRLPLDACARCSDKLTNRSGPVKRDRVRHGRPAGRSTRPGDPPATIYTALAYRPHYHTTTSTIYRHCGRAYIIIRLAARAPQRASHIFCIRFRFEPRAASAKLVSCSFVVFVFCMWSSAHNTNGNHQLRNCYAERMRPSSAAATVAASSPLRRATSRNTHIRMHIIAKQPSLCVEMRLRLRQSV